MVVSPGCPDGVAVLGRWLYPEGGPAGQPSVEARKDRNTIDMCILALKGRSTKYDPAPRDSARPTASGRKGVVGYSYSGAEYPARLSSSRNAAPWCTLVPSAFHEPCSNATSGTRPFVVHGLSWHARRERLTPRSDELSGLRFRGK